MIKIQNYVEVPSTILHTDQQLSKETENNLKEFHDIITCTQKFLVDFGT